MAAASKLQAIFNLSLQNNPERKVRSCQGVRLLLGIHRTTVVWHSSWTVSTHMVPVPDYHDVPAGNPPKRLQGSDDDNIQDIMNRVEKVAEEKENQRLQNDKNLQEIAAKQEKEKYRGSDDVAAV